MIEESIPLRWREAKPSLRGGAYGHTLGAAVGLGWIETGSASARDLIAKGGFEIEIAGERFAAVASLAPFYDPKHERIRR